MSIKIKPQSIGKILLLIGMLAALSYISKNLKTKEDTLNNQLNSNYIKNYLLDHNEILKSTKPIIWIHIPREKNARKWDNFASPNSDNLNMPFIYLTVRSIIEKCNESFTICLIDDDSFAKLLPGWEINLDKIKGPTLDNVRTMGFLKLLFLYGGILCPNSFLCQRNLIDLYNLSYTNDIAVSFQMKNVSTSNTLYQYLPNIRFMVSYPQNETIKQLSSFMEQVISRDNTNETQFLQRIGMQCQNLVNNNKISLHDGSLIGIKNANNKDVLLEHLFSSDFVNFDDNRYGILIPDIQRRKFEWFNYLNAYEIMTSDTTIGKQILLTLGNNIEHNDNVDNSVKETPNFNIDVNTLTQNISLDEIHTIHNTNIGYWNTPLDAPIWGLKPNFLGNNLIKK